MSWLDDGHIRCDGCARIVKTQGRLMTPHHVLPSSHNLKHLCEHCVAAGKTLPHDGIVEESPAIERHKPGGPCPDNGHTSRHCNICYP